MYIQRDKEIDQLYINFSKSSEEGAVHKTETVEVLSGRVNLDLDAEGRLIGVEIIGAKDVIGASADKIDFSSELVGVKEAAELAGKDNADFLKDLASREDFPEPIVSLASGPYWLSAEIKRYLRKVRKALAYRRA